MSASPQCSPEAARPRRSRAVPCRSRPGRPLRRAWPLPCGRWGGSARSCPARHLARPIAALHQHRGRPDEQRFKRNAITGQRALLQAGQAHPVGSDRGYADGLPATAEPDASRVATGRVARSLSRRASHGFARCGSPNAAATARKLNETSSSALTGRRSIARIPSRFAMSELALPPPPMVRTAFGRLSEHFLQANRGWTDAAGPSSTGAIPSGPARGS